MPGAMYAKVAGTWGQVFPPLPPAYNDATGGDITEFDEVVGGTPTGRRMRVHTFTGNDTFTVIKNDSPFRVLLVGSGSGSWDRQNGTWIGGCPGVVSDTTQPLTVEAHAVTVGGAVGDNAQGQPSSLGTLTAAGGTIVGNRPDLSHGPNGPITDNTITGAVVRYGERPNPGGPAVAAGQPSIAGVVIVAYEIAPPIYNDATGGDVTMYTRDGKWFRVHTFLANDTFTVNAAPQPFRTLVCPGGGGGGVAMNANGGGKGRGGKPVVNDATTLAAGSHAVVVGGGGGRAPDQDWGAGAGGGTSSLGDISAGGGGGGGGGESPYTGDAYTQNASIEAAYNDPSTWVSSDITGTVAKYGHDGSWGGPQYEGPNGSGPGGGGRGGGNGWGNRGNPTGGNAGVVIVSYEIAPIPVSDATGGVTAEYVTVDGQKWRSHTFNGSGTLTITKAESPFRVMALGGGGGGASQHHAYGNNPGPGGNGEAATWDDVVLAVGDVNISVGGGGAGGPTGECNAYSPGPGSAGGGSSVGDTMTVRGGGGGYQDGGNSYSGPSVVTAIRTGVDETYAGNGFGGGGAGHVGSMDCQGGGPGQGGRVIVAYRIG